MTTYLHKSKLRQGGLWFTVLVMLLQSCGKESSIEEPSASVEIPAGMALLHFGIEGIVEGAAGQTQRVAKASLAGNTSGFESETLGEDFDLQVSFSQENASGARPGRVAGVKAASMDAKAQSSVSTFSAMPVGHKYAVLVYEADGAFVGKIEGTSGANEASKSTLVVDGGKIYKWVAYSLNTTTLPGNPAKADGTAYGTLEGSTYTTIFFNTPTKTDFLLDQGTVETFTDKESPIRISFKHQVAKLAVKINTRGLFGAIDIAGNKLTNLNNGNQSSFSVSWLKSSLISLSDGTVKSSKSVAANTAESSIYSSELENTAEEWEKMAYFYTSTTDVSENSLVRANNFNLKLDYGGPRRFRNKDLALGNPAIRLEEGSVYSLQLRFLEIPVDINNQQWARANLYVENGVYKFWHHNSNFYEKGPGNTTRTKKDYFSFPNEDLCMKVYPEGRWRMAVEEDYNKIKGKTEIFPSKPNNTTIYNYSGHSGDPVNYLGFRRNISDVSPYAPDGRWVNFLANGFINPEGHFENFQTANGVESFGYYWVNIGTPQNARYFQFSIRPVETPTKNFSISVKTVVKPRSKLNIRCIRNI